MASFFRQFISYCIIGILFFVHGAMEFASYVFEFLEDVEDGAEDFLIELGWEITKIDD